MSLVVKFIKITPAAVTPRIAREGDAGVDLTVTTVKEGIGYIEYGTGLAMEIPPGYVGLLFPRSSVSTTGLALANSVGVVDSGYRGEIRLRYRAVVSGATGYQVGDKCGQLVVLELPFVEYTECTELGASSRGDGGFGSTGQ